MQFQNFSVKTCFLNDNLTKAKPKNVIKLSEERAASVKNALISLGVSDNRMETEAYGETRPVQNNATAAGRKANRRVKFQRRVEIKIAE